MHAGSIPPPPDGAHTYMLGKCYLSQRRGRKSVAGARNGGGRSFGANGQRGRALASAGRAVATGHWSLPACRMRLYAGRPPADLRYVKYDALSRVPFTQFLSSSPTECKNAKFCSEGRCHHQPIVSR
jgi:hypothetical protein